MERYSLAKFVQWSGTLHSRKKMQKVVFLLQAAGCPFDADFLLHTYGPYSSELAQLTDEMVRAGILAEECVGNLPDQRFNYRLVDTAVRSLEEFEGTVTGRQAAASLAKYEPFARVLIEKSTEDLEVAATIAYFLTKGDCWVDAIRRTCEFKHVAPDTAVLQHAEAIAKHVLEPTS